MPDLPSNITYRNLRGAIAPMLKTAQEIGRSLPQPKSRNKRVDISGFKGLMNQMGNFNTAQSTPATVPSSVSSLGQISTPYMGSTKFEPGGHPGLDYTLSGMGSPVTSFTPGTVEEVKTGQVKGSPGFGNFVSIRDSAGNLHRFSHLMGTWVRVGQQVERGTSLGPEGNTGQVYSLQGGSGAHVDYRVKNLYNQYISPYQFING